MADVYKSLPYRGQQRFPSWLGYVWPEERGAFHHEGEMAPFPNFGDELKGYDDGLNREWILCVCFLIVDSVHWCVCVYGMMLCLVLKDTLNGREMKIERLV